MSDGNEFLKQNEIDDILARGGHLAKHEERSDEQIPAVSDNARYIIVEESVSAHCCFEYTIIDTFAGKQDYGDYWKRSMCETFNRERAEIICDALNKHCR